MSEQETECPWPQRFEDEADSNGLIRIDEDTYNYADIRVQACAGIEDESLWILADNDRTLKMYITEIEQQRDKMAHQVALANGAVILARQQRDELAAQVAQLVESCKTFRDSVLHQRWNLEGNGMTSDQINDVLNLFDTLVGDELEKAGQQS